MKIEKFTYPSNTYLSAEDQMKVLNQSDHQNHIHQIIFNQMDELAKMVIKDIHNNCKEELFKESKMNIVASFDSIKELMEDNLGGKINNPELIHKSFNFQRPKNLIPWFDKKLILIRQQGLDINGQENTYLINPYFFSYLISFYIYMVTILCKHHEETIEDGLLIILTDKYGEEYKDIYKYVGTLSYKASSEGGRNGDKEDETLIASMNKLSGIISPIINENYIYNSSLVFANRIQEVLQSN